MSLSHSRAPIFEAQYLINDRSNEKMVFITLIRGFENIYTRKERIFFWYTLYIVLKTMINQIWVFVSS